MLSLLVTELTWNHFLWADIFLLFCVLYSTLLHLATNAGIEPRTVATVALAVRRFNH
jgi:hypothetical protein